MAAFVLLRSWVVDMPDAATLHTVYANALVSKLRDEEGLTFPISYHFEPGAADDGLTIDVPVATLNRIEADDFSWLVPGLREELVTELIRSLPKNLRVAMVPAPNTARASSSSGKAARTPSSRSRSTAPRPNAPTPPKNSSRSSAGSPSTARTPRSR